MDQFASVAIVTAIELGLFAAILFAVFGVDDLLVDALHIGGIGTNRLPPVPRDGKTAMRFAVMVPAWQESDTIGAMLRTLLHRWADAHIRVYVGVYQNDLATLLAVVDVAKRDDRVRIVINDAPGPTTKAGCLNRMWCRCMADAATGQFHAEALLLHDAEDVVDAAELYVLAQALEGAEFAQLPVVPMRHRDSPWVSGHYCDEFAEAHGKDMPVRCAIGAALPLAGVGCAVRMSALRRLAGTHGPFGSGSLTEDYELGLRLAESGARGAFVRRRTEDGRLVASRGYFPCRIESAVRQKTRWLRGNALEAWDHLGWLRLSSTGNYGQWATWWMLWRDRRAALSAVAILCAYVSLIAGLLAQALFPTMVAAALAEQPTLVWLSGFNLMLLLWRALVRTTMVGRLYGWSQAPMALARIPVSNIILVMTAWRALLGYWRGRSGAALVWDKTAHHFPDDIGLETALDIRR